ncbi:O120 family O-antigen polymerase [Escherichia coli]|uniref:O120 family O-antigen polymerase n=1 Tax=Escherichia coli TaxID=562 RepID=UPI001C4409E9|nr:O120 family O-antigen polymerase [Escherichia coli]EKG7070730.1 O120 family O-antigen polymerase [Escherichia coli]EKY6913931.1 O120 family O-antigen polymerase [Escherichia coli]MBV7128104.1 O120 family O-antigen polymerase [Escherichia coli]MCX9197091.1 O120 family O-antigen polymerase [Escherichia coli]HBB9607239.1 O120 family O-antigen polymerase [Escherichia coli]
MNVRDNDNAIKLLEFVLIFSFFLIALFFLYSPSYLIYIVVSAFVLIKFNNNYSFGLFILLIMVWLVVNSTNVISYQNFVLASDDFSSYYNNYLGFLHYGINEENLFEFGYSEIMLPLLNYIASLIIGQPEPYKLKFLYSILQSTGVLYCCVKISRHYKLDLSNSILLTAAVLVFYKPLVGIQLSRQMFSSIFIIAFIFTNNKFERVIFALIAFCFHSSAIVLLPITQYLLTKRKRKDLYYSLIIVLLAYAAFIVVFTSFKNELINIPVLNKLDYTFRMFNEPEKIKQSVFTSFLLLIYLIPALIFSILNKKSDGFKYNIAIICVFLISFCIVPGFNNRLFFAELYVFLGFFYYMVFFYNRVNAREHVSRLIIFILFTILFFQSQFSSENRRFDSFELEPFYYLKYLEYRETEINRGLLE